MLSNLASGAWRNQACPALKRQRCAEGPEDAMDTLLQGLLIHMDDHFRKSFFERLMAKGRTTRIRMGTACSGTDVAVVVAQHMARILGRLASMDETIDFSHAWSCEIEGFKQRFIMDNFKVQHLYGDIVELASTHAKNVANAGAVEVIEEVDCVICGFSCEHLSALKKHEADANSRRVARSTALALELYRGPER